MRERHFATSNAGKFASLERALAEYAPEVRAIQVKMEFDEPRSDDLKLISREKALFAYRRIQREVVANDAGFYVGSLNGFPKAFVNFCLGTIGIEGILALVAGKERECEFRNVLAYYNGSSEEPVFFESVSPGHLSPEPRGTRKAEQWSDLFLVFIPEGEEKTLAEMSPAEYSGWLERRREDSAMAQFARWYAGRSDATLK